MKAVPAYLTAVLIASFLIGQEVMLASWVQHRLAGKVDDLWIGMVGAALFATPFIMLVALAISVVPFLLFYPLYRRQRSHTACSTAMVFGVLIAFAGLSLMESLFARRSEFDPWRTGVVALLSLPIGLASGWIFHKTVPSPASVDPTERTLGEVRRDVAS